MDYELKHCAYCCEENESVWWDEDVSTYLCSDYRKVERRAFVAFKREIDKRRRATLREKKDAKR